MVSDIKFWPVIFKSILLAQIFLLGSKPCILPSTGCSSWMPHKNFILNMSQTFIELWLSGFSVLCVCTNEVKDKEPAPPGSFIISVLNDNSYNGGMLHACYQTTGITLQNKNEKCFKQISHFKINTWGAYQVHIKTVMCSINWNLEAAFQSSPLEVNHGKRQYHI